MNAFITEITASVGRVKGLIEEVSEASRQQTQGIDQVARAVQQMETVTQSTAATAEETAAASEELNAQAEVTMASASNLHVLVTGVLREVPAVRRRPSAASSVEKMPLRRVA